MQPLKFCPTELQATPSRLNLAHGSEEAAIQMSDQLSMGDLICTGGSEGSADCPLLKLGFVCLFVFRVFSCIPNIFMDWMKHISHHYYAGHDMYGSSFL